MLSLGPGESLALGFGEEDIDSRIRHEDWTSGLWQRRFMTHPRLNLIALVGRR